MSTTPRLFTRNRIIASLFNLLLYPILLFGFSGDLHWTEAWIFTAWHVLQTVVATIFLYYKDPDLLVERFRKPGSGGHKSWDKVYFQLLVLSCIAGFAVIGLDRRFLWTHDFALWLQVAGGVLIVGSFWIMMVAAGENTFASPYVRIDTERHQRVISTGIYGIIRHPMYLGSILLIFGTALFLGSCYGTLLAIVQSALFVGRTIGEEKMLVTELEGYPEYKQNVRYRLIPFVW